jgi:hypothetical protein
MRAILALLSRGRAANIGGAHMTAARALLLGAALAPYLALVSVDTWMHETARNVPRAEKFFHYAAALLFGGFIAAIFLDSGLALPLLLAFVLCAAADEFGFHRHLSAAERRVHFVSYAALALFVGAWRLLP